MTYQAGNTVRLTAEFKDWEGVSIDPETVKLIIYDYRYTKLSEFEVPTANRINVGTYFYDHVFETGLFIYEWLATIDGKPSLVRKQISISNV
ncbi:hypothetical protein QUF56_09425 [Ureibacillus composti]|nr:hypothetical protein [Ureibacillus composti]